MATNISADGQYVTGFTTPPEGGTSGFTWSRSGGLVEWGRASGVPLPTRPVGISDDGSVVAGFREFPSGIGTILAARTFRYSNGSYQELGVPVGVDQIYSRGMSGSGSTIVGYLGAANGTRRQTAYRWTAATGIQDLGTPRPGDFGAGFTGISRDGSTAFGISAAGIGGADAFTWTQTSGWRMLPVPAEIGPAFDARPSRSNTTGSIVVGGVQPTGLDTRAIVWNDGAPTLLGSVGSTISMAATGVSDDGSVVVGTALDGSRARLTATIWLGGTSPLVFQDYLASLGVTTPSGWRLAECNNISADGSTISGYAQSGSQTQAFVAVIPAPGSLGAFALFVGVAFTRRNRRTRPPFFLQ